METTAEEYEEFLAEAMHSAGAIVVFLMAAMFLVEIAVYLRLFYRLRLWIGERYTTDKAQFLAISSMAFATSAFLDNVVMAIVWSTIAVRFFIGRNLLVAGIGIIVSANAGGAWSPIGDVTTIMLYFEGKFTALEVVTEVSLASLTMFSVTIGLLSRLVLADSPDRKPSIEGGVSITRYDWIVIGVALGAFTLPVTFEQFFGAPAFMGLALGLALAWIVFELMKSLHLRNGYEDEPAALLEIEIGHFLRGIDMKTIFFIFFIIFAVDGISFLGILEEGSEAVLGENPSLVRAGTVFYFGGYISAFLDNVPFVKIAIEAVHTEDARLWTFLAYTVGVGGSHLLIGSLAGVTAGDVLAREERFERERLKEEGVPQDEIDDRFPEDVRMNSASFFKYGFVPVFLGYNAGTFVWVLQTYLLS